MGIAIKVENVSKLYKLGEVSTGTVSHDLNKWWAKIRGKEDPYLKIGDTNNRAVKGNSEYVWALKDINFEVNHGDLVGIIGKNGAGKSTLLKILSRTTSPTTGSLKAKGRIASLLEVGTGFHPELTGRENIFLNGAILGMRKNEIKAKFDEIVSFSGVERYIDTPVKRYSSGMYVRLAFAVAAHLESEILIVDEVLAVGDAEFQQKCLGKMDQASKTEGRTILLVSHNMPVMEKITKKAILLQNGTMVDFGQTSEICKKYFDTKADSLAGSINGIFSFDLNTPKRQMAFGPVMKSCEVFHNGERGHSFSMGENLTLKLYFEHTEDIVGPILGLIFKDYRDEPILAINNIHYTLKYTGLTMRSGVFQIDIKELPLMSGSYSVDLRFGSRADDIDVIEDAITIEVLPKAISDSGFMIESSLNKFFIKNVNWDLQKK